MGIDTTQFKDEKKNNALQKAQQETYQLIDSVSALKDTITTLSPVLSQGKEIIKSDMDSIHANIQNLKKSEISLDI